MTDVLHLVQHDPLVVSVRTGSSDPPVHSALMAQHPDRLFAVVVAEPDLGLLRALVDCGDTRIREVVFTAVAGDAAQTLALRGIEQLGLGQDLVYTVPGFDDAVAYATQAVLISDAGGWDADAILVIGSC